MIKLLITEYALKKQEMEWKLHDIVSPIVHRLIKCYLMPISESYNHWKSEIANSLREVKALKGTNKFPTAKQIYDWTYGSYYDSVNNQRWMKAVIQEIQEDYDILIDTPIYDLCLEINALCYNYFTWLSNVLSVNGFTSRKSIFDKIDKLIKQVNE